MNTTNQNIPKLDEGWTFYGRGPLLVKTDPINMDVARWDPTWGQDKWDYSGWEGKLEDGYYALRTGSEIARLNGLSEPQKDLRNAQDCIVELGKALDDFQNRLDDSQNRLDDEIATTVALNAENTELRQRLDRMEASRDAWQKQCGIWSDKYENLQNTEELEAVLVTTRDVLRKMTNDRDAWKAEAERWRDIAPVEELNRTYAELEYWKGTNNSQVLEEFNKHTALGHKFFGADGRFPDALVIGQDVVLDGMWWLADEHKRLSDKIEKLRGVAGVACNALNRISKES